MILLIFTPEDLAFLPEAIKRLRAMAVEYLWVLHAPQLGLPYPPSAKVIDDELVAVARDKQRAIMAENFDDAGKYRNQENDLKVKRELEIKNAYKAIPANDILAIYDRTFAELNEGTTGIPNIVREALPDPIAPDQALSYLAGRGTDWYDQFPHGNYALFWIRALPESTFSKTFQKAAPAGDYTQGTVASLTTPDNELDRLANLPWDKLRTEAKAAGVATYGKKREQIAKEILAALTEV